MSNCKLQIFCDFDGTITQDDTVDVLLDKLALPEWEAIEAAWVQGKIGSRQCMASQVPLIQGGWNAVRGVLDDVELCDGFSEFVNWCRKNSFGVVVVSDGLDRTIQYLLDRHKITVDKIYANRLMESPDGSFYLQFNDNTRLANCQSGVCKCQIANNIGAQALKVIIGDGRSDFCWAKEADILFAKSKLADYCYQQKLAFNTFDTFSTIQGLLDTFIQGQSDEIIFNQPVLVPNMIGSRQFAYAS